MTSPKRFIGYNAAIILLIPSCIVVDAAGRERSDASDCRHAGSHCDWVGGLWRDALGERESDRHDGLGVVPGGAVESARSSIVGHRELDGGARRCRGGGSSRRPGRCRCRRASASRRVHILRRVHETAEQGFARLVAVELIGLWN